MKTVSRSIPLLVSLLALVVPAPAAFANEYVVYSCKTPSGAAAPTDGWSANAGAIYSWSSDTCASGGSLGAGMGGPSQISNAAKVGWGFDSGAAPIHGYSINRDGRASGTGYGVSMLMFTANGANNSDGAHSVDYCAVYAGCSTLGGLLTRDAGALPGDSHSWFFSLACGGYADQVCTHDSSAADFGQINIRSAAFTLEDSGQPSVDEVSGSLIAEGASFGALTFLASDDITGIARAAIESDGTEVVATVPNSNGGRCQRLGQAGSTNDYLYRRPCPLHQQVELTLPRNTLTNGEHVMRARAYDAAGNGVTVFGPRRIQVTGSNVTGLSAAHFSIDGPSSVVASYGKNVRITGTLLANTGEPISGARIESTLESKSAARTRIARVVQADLDGRFSFTVRALANRTFNLTNADTGASLAGKLKVHSRISLRAARKRVPPLGKMRLSGRIPSERAKHGASVAIKVKSGRRWRTVAVVRASRVGEFKFAYKFRRISHARLKFRAVALKSSDLTVSPTPSKTLTIRVGG
jgi:hypothetical protein